MAEHPEKKRWEELASKQMKGKSPSIHWTG